MTPIDTFMWRTSETNLKDDLESHDFEFCIKDQKVGKCSVQICKNAYGLLGNYRFFPVDWFCEQSEITDLDYRQARLKPFVEITNFDFSDFQGQGYGRMGLQKIYALSQEVGAEGRLTLIAQRRETSRYNPAFFYEHCGFAGNLRQEGRKFFDPTPNNVQNLFSKSASDFFKMREIPYKVGRNSLINMMTGELQPIRLLKEILARQKQ